jgi:hypothetical protein
VASPRIGTVRGETRAIRTGDHRSGGLVLLRHDGVSAGPLAEPVPVVDLAPTVASWFGVALADVDGAPLTVSAEPAANRVEP